MGFFAFFCVVALILLGVLCTTAYLCYLVRHSNHGKSPLHIRRNSISLCCVMGSGGHTAEMIQLLENLDDRYNPRLYIIASKDKISVEKVSTFEKTRNSGTYAIATIPRSREVHQSYMSSIVTTLYSFCHAVNIVWNAKPDLVLVNGPGTCIPVVLAAAILDMVRLRDTVIIYEESLCRVERLSLSGALLYYSGLADDIIVQWQNLKEKYPRATLVHDIEE